ncbi:MAG: DUF3347 domain-containing protein [Chitinophagales bacterium]|nr:DUF3347 domain-containing protein [Chitinophagales bacterium]
MKKLIIAVAIVASAFVQNSFAQTTGAQSLNNVLSAYINLKNALAIDKGDSARASAKILFNTIAKVPMDKLTAEQHKIWMQYADQLSYHAEHIKGTNELEHQREHFVTLSGLMYKAMKELNINTNVLYYQYCPMANDGKGAYWVSEDSKIRNPYMGKKMPSCGSTKDSIQVKN